MATSFLSEADRLRLSNFPEDVVEGDLDKYFKLSDTDKKKITYRRHGEANRIGFALQYCTLRFMGFVPDDLSRAPQPIITYLAAQLSIRWDL